MNSGELEHIGAGLSLPLTIGSDSGFAVLDPESTIRALLLQILFTAPGERVNRPDFGVGILDRVFDPNSPFLANQIRRQLVRNVQEHLGSEVEITGVDVSVDAYDPTVMRLLVAYVLPRALSGPRQLQLHLRRLVP